MTEPIPATFIDGDDEDEVALTVPSAASAQVVIGLHAALPARRQHLVLSRRAALCLAERLVKAVRHSLITD
jgi:hypothetical protein